MADLIQLRRDTLERWNQYNPILAEGEVGLVLGDVNFYKIGDGVHAWNDLRMKGFNGNILEDLGDSPDAVISQRGISRILDNIINNESLIEIRDDNWDTLNDVILPGVYVIKINDTTIYHLLVNKNKVNENNQYNQWIIGNLMINDIGQIEEDVINSIIVRSKINEEWSQWKYYQESFIKQNTGDKNEYSISQKFFTATINDLLKQIEELKKKINEEMNFNSSILNKKINEFQKTIDEINGRIDDIENSVINNI